MHRLLWRGEFATDTTLGLRCVGASCTKDSNCSSPTPGCNTTIGRCVQCTLNTHCTGANQSCDKDTNKCVTCTWDTDYTCNNNNRVKHCREGGKILATKTLSCATNSECSGGVCVVQPSCSADTTDTSWTISGKTCTGKRPETDHGDSTTITDTTGTTTGEATYSCNKGSWSSPSNATCDAPCAADTTDTSWTVNGKTCTAKRPATIHGGSATITDTAGTTSGSATYACSAGVWGSPTNTSCTDCKPPVDGGWTSWSPSPSSTTCGTSFTQTRTCTNPSPSCGGTSCTGSSSQSATGTKCSSGQSCVSGQCSSSCSSTNDCPCPANSFVTWTVGSYSCQTTSNLYAPHGTVRTFSANHTDTQGSATGSCTNGSWITSNPVCAPDFDCKSGPVFWSSADGNTHCGSPITPSNTGTRRSLRSSRSYTNGYATFECSSSGSWVLQPGSSCSYQSCMKCGTTTVSWGDGGACGTSIIYEVCEDREVSVSYTSDSAEGAATYKCYGDYSSPGNPSASWRLESSSCTQYCSARSQVSWTVGGKTCSASAARTAENEYITLTDNATPNTGSAQITCYQLNDDPAYWGNPYNESCN